VSCIKLCVAKIVSSIISDWALVLWVLKGGNFNNNKLPFWDEDGEQ
jgi:hypothetical protein